MANVSDVGPFAVVGRAANRFHRAVFAACEGDGRKRHCPGRSVASRARDFKATENTSWTKTEGHQEKGCPQEESREEKGNPQKEESRAVEIASKLPIHQTIRKRRFDRMP